MDQRIESYEEEIVEGLIKVTKIVLKKEKELKKLSQKEDLEEFGVKLKKLLETTRILNTGISKLCKTFRKRKKTDERYSELQRQIEQTIRKRRK